MNIRKKTLRILSLASVRLPTKISNTLRPAALQILLKCHKLSTQPFDIVFYWLSSHFSITGN